MPCIDLCFKFGIKTAEYTDRTCIVVMEIDTTAARVQIGIVVDLVSKVLSSRDFSALGSVT
jgi:purine-binding chemotaxis protein CheW